MRTQLLALTLVLVVRNAAGRVLLQSGRATAIGTGVASNASASLVTSNEPGDRFAAGAAGVSSVSSPGVPATAFTDVFTEVDDVNASVTRSTATDDGNITQVSGAGVSEINGTYNSEFNASFLTPD
ncbi:hypothetical protein QBZ16_001924 [Prototheca wickerhamii]|uniref:Uncharacterized protein n=1 Tax=Prototheca wickerhamii TaxID=3111 RepID=A0AAD9MLD1_PROWI|nr:hypothetical protein QBZ16_001924 [Prototheca wickerhamii]